MCRPLHSKKVTVWAAMRKGQPLIGPLLFKDEDENSVIINAEGYIVTALRRFWTALRRRHGLSREEEWLEQNEAAPPQRELRSTDWRGTSRDDTSA